MTQAEIKRLMKKPEGKTLEFKRDLASLQPVIRTLVAFANTAGGTLVVGLDDDGQVRGLKDAKADEERLANAVSESISPTLLPDIEVVRSGGKDILVIRVARWPGPFYVRREGEERGVYVRLGSTNRRADETIRQELERASQKLAYDELPCIGAEPTDLDRDAVTKVFATVSRVITDAALETLGLVVRYGESLIPSNGGIILFGTSVARRRFFNDARIRCPLFAGSGKAEFLDRLDIDGSVLMALNDVPKFIRRNTRMAARIEGLRRQDIPEYPAVSLPGSRMLTRGITHVHHLFMPRQLRIVALLWSKALTAQDVVKSMVLFWLDQSIAGLSLFNRYGPTHFSQVNRQMSGVCYVPSQLSECSPWYNLRGKLSRLTRAFRARQALPSSCTSGTGSSTALRLAENSFDYIFIDPPFGDNFAYAELNFLVEAWLGVRTNMAQETIVDRSKKNRSIQKGLDEYRSLMTACFTEAYRVLKPGRWMTVEFSNTKASVWNGIQTALAEAGFIIANVAALDKQQGSFKAVTTPTAVKQDLVISAYKSNGGFEERFKQEAETEAGVWDFVRTHMKYLPVTKLQDGIGQPIPERDPRILFDQMVAFYVRKGYPVPLSSQEFQVGLAQRFVPRDGMYFLSDQAAEYDKFSASHGRPAQMSLFVFDEASAIDWLRNLLRNKPQTSADINPQFMKELGGWSKHEKPLDLRDLLNQNFLCYDGKGPVPEQIHAYLSTNWKELRNLEKDASALVAKAKDRWYVPDPNKAGDLERLRERALLREFWEYLPEGHKPLVKLDTSVDLPGLVVPQPKIPTGKRMRIIRTEAVRVGFKYCWQHQDYRTIIAVAKRIPEDVLQEDPKLLMWYDQALTRLGEE